MAELNWHYWWSLPGPSRFVRTLVEELRKGVNLVIGLPRWAPDGLAQALDREMFDDELLSRRPLELNNNLQDDPLDLVVSRYATDLSIHNLRDPIDLVDSNAFSHNLIWVTGLDEQTWGLWIDFLKRYADAVRRRPAEERGLFCLVVCGLPPEAFPKDDVALSVKLWREAVNEVDMLAWLHHLSSYRPMRSTMHRRLHLRLALELVAYDPHLAGDAAYQSLDVLAAPATWLASVAAVRGWTAETPKAWNEGTCDTIEDRHLCHPARLAVENVAPLDSLVWRAQLSVLFPILEEERNRFLEKYAHFLKLPYETSYGTIINNRQDLELGHIYHQLKRINKIKDLERIGLLRDARNALAHLHPLSPEELQKL